MTTAAHQAPSAAAGAAGAAFRYTGHTSLMVRGPVTGRNYHFASAGAVLAVDPRDAPSLAAVPQLLPAFLPRQSS
jgi:hypothetical protein